MKFQKKRVIVDAYQTDKDMYIETLEGVMHASHRRERGKISL